jgi:hypothetical protein
MRLSTGWLSMSNTIRLCLLMCAVAAAPSALAAINNISFEGQHEVEAPGASPFGGSSRWLNPDPLPSAGGAANPPPGGTSPAAVTGQLVWDDVNETLSGFVTIADHVVQGGPDGAGDFDEITKLGLTHTLVEIDNTTCVGKTTSDPNPPCFTVTDNGDGTTTIVAINDPGPAGAVFDDLNTFVFVEGTGCADGPDGNLSTGFFNGRCEVTTVSATSLDCTEYDPNGNVENDPCGTYPTDNPDQATFPGEPMTPFEPWDAVTVTFTVNNADNSLVDGTIEYTQTGDLFRGVNPGTQPDDFFWDYTISFAAAEVSDLPVANDANAPAIDTQGAAPESQSSDIDVSAIGGNSLGTEPTVVTATDGTNGTTTVTGNDISYVPNADFFAGVDTYDYTLTDDNGDVATATVTVTVTDIDPVAGDLMAMTGVDTPVDIDLTPGITPGNGEVSDHVIEVSMDPADGTAVLAGLTVTYTPGQGFRGTDTFEYSVTDANGDVDTGVVTVDVDEERQPIANDADFNSLLNQPIDIDVSTIAGNDLGNAPSTVTATDGNNGTTAVVGSVITYTPAPDFEGVDTFDYTITDADGEESTGTITIDVQDLPIVRKIPGGSAMDPLSLLGLLALAWAGLRWRRVA